MILLSIDMNLVNYCVEITVHVNS